MISSDLRENLAEESCCIVIPTFNNRKTLIELLEELNSVSDSVIIVNDGSNDGTSEFLESISGFSIISYTKNQGKGYALKRAFSKALELGYKFAITMDSDGQHLTEDLNLFLKSLNDHPGSLLIGSRNLQAENMPGKNTFGNKFSNFWFHLQTGKKLPDTQSGFRLYPIEKLKNLKLFSGKYEFEFEILVRSAWRRIPVIPIQISVYYPPENERISHFRPFRDFFRISVLNTFLTISALLIFRPYLFIRSLTKENIKKFIKNEVVKAEESNEKKAAAIGFGVFMGIFPVWGYQMILAVLIAHWLKLNKAIVLLASNISMGPMIPVFIYFSYVFGGIFLSNPEELVFDLDQIEFETIKNQLFQYIVGSVTLSISAGLSFGLVSYILLKLFRKEGVLKT